MSNVEKIKCRAGVEGSTILNNESLQSAESLFIWLLQNPEELIKVAISNSAEGFGV